jgi:hypothetical protein
LGGRAEGAGVLRIFTQMDTRYHEWLADPVWSSVRGTVMESVQVSVQVSVWRAVWGTMGDPLWILVGVSMRRALDET